MTWDAVGAIAESIGACAVIFTIMYLAVQLRQSNRIARAQTYSDRSAAGRDMIKWASEQRLIDLVVKAEGLEKEFGYEKIQEHLSNEETKLLGQFYQAWMQHYDNLHYQFEMGLMEQEAFEDRISAIQNSARWFKVFGISSRRLSFQKYLDSIDEYS